MLNRSNVAHLLIVAASISAGQILFKLGSARIGEHASLVEALARALSGFMIAGCVLYVLAAALWVHVLREVPLSIAYPFMSLSFLLVPLLGAVFLNESIDAGYWAGMVLVVMGLYLVMR